MSQSEIWSIALSVLASLGGGGVIVFALSNWLGKIWANRVLETERARHANELEKAKAELSSLATDRERKLKSLMDHYGRQIEEFYGPLFNMVNQVHVANDIQEKMLSAKDESGAPRLAPDKAEIVTDYFQKTYFYPLHDEIIKIFRSKLYLIEGSEIPRSFDEYLKHATQQRDQRTLWQDHQIDTAFLEGRPWPRYFNHDMEKGFEQAMKNYENCVEGLRRIAPSVDK